MTHFFTLKKSFIFFLATLTLLSVLVLIALYNLILSTDRLKQIEAYRYASTELATNYKNITQAMTRDVMAFVATEQPEFYASYQHHTAVLHGQAPDSRGLQQAMMERFRLIGFMPEEMDMLESAYAQSQALAQTEIEAINTARGEFDDGQGNVKVALPNALMAKVMIFGQQYTGASQAVADTIDEFNIMQTRRFAQDVYNADRASKMAYWMAVLAILTLLACSAAALWALYRTIKKPLDQGVLLAQRLAAGDLSARVDLKRHDELGKLLEALNGIGIGLHQAVGDVQERALQMASAARHISTGNRNLAERTDEQAADLQQTAAAMQQLSVTVQKNAENAEHAKQLVVQSTTCATQGSLTVHSAMDIMQKIRLSSHKIADITGLINTVAFQTNILALNAAVEAARAGQHGNGFAVVAAEVRNLALRSAAAAKEIKELIEESVLQIDTGANLVDKAGHAIDEIVRSVQQVQGIMNDIADASGQQAIGIGQVTVSISHLDVITQKNVIQVQDAVNATQLQNEQAGGLAATLARFTLNTVKVESDCKEIDKDTYLVKHLPIAEQLGVYA